MRRGGRAVCNNHCKDAILAGSDLSLEAVERIWLFKPEGLS